VPDTLWVSRNNDSLLTCERFGSWSCAWSRLAVPSHAPLWQNKKRTENPGAPPPMKKIDDGAAPAAWLAPKHDSKHRPQTDVPSLHSPICDRLRSNANTAPGFVDHRHFDPHSGGNAERPRSRTSRGRFLLPPRLIALEQRWSNPCHSACNIGSDAILVQLRLICAD
jgi:hypothetical protein